MPESPDELLSEDNSRAYYDEFADRYEKRRGRNVPGGYHELLDQLESSYVEKFGHGKDVLEVGCGTGLILMRIRDFAKSAQGIDLSAGMLEHARQRGLTVAQGSATALPFENDSFDVTCSFKVLAHVPEIETALAEMARVTRPGGQILAEFYNPQSIRGLLRLIGPKRAIGQSRTEGDVFTRFDSPAEARRLTPPGCSLIGARGVRVITPAARLVDAPIIGPAFSWAERALADSPLRRFAGFYIAAYQKDR